MHTGSFSILNVPARLMQTVPVTPLMSTGMTFVNSYLLWNTPPRHVFSQTTFVERRLGDSWHANALWDFVMPLEMSKIGISSDYVRP